MKTKRIFISVLFGSILLFMGCIDTQKSGESETGEEEVDTSSVKGLDTTPLNDTRIAKPSSASLLFDASVSMKGYLNSSDSRFVGVISTFENMPSTVINHFYGISEGNSIGATEFDSMLESRKIEWSHESDLKSMVQSMINHVNGGDDVCFLVTDGILSGSNEQIKRSPDRSYNIINREKMSTDLSSMLGSYADSLCALIVRYKARFNGTYSCYNNDGKSLTNKERPFFVIALGKWEAIKYVEIELNRAKTSNSIKTPYEDIVMIGDARSYQKIKLSAAEGLNPKDGKMVVKRDFRNESIVLSADMGNLPTYMQAEDYMNANTELFVQRGQKAEKKLDKEYYEVTVNNDNGKNKLRLSIKASQLKDSKLIFKLRYALPDWIENKSDDNDHDIDTNPIKLDKTFNLKYFVAGFAALHNGNFIKEQSLEFK